MTRRWIPLPRKTPHPVFCGVEVLEPDGRHRYFRGFDNWHKARIFELKKAPILFPGCKIIFHSNPLKTCNLFFKTKDPRAGIDLDGYECFHCGVEISRDTFLKQFVCNGCLREAELRRNLP